MYTKKLAIRVIACMLGMVFILTFSACNNSALQEHDTAGFEVPANTANPPQDSNKVTARSSDILSKLEKAYNAQDLDAIVRCFDPNRVNAISDFIGIFGSKSSAMKQIVPFFSEEISASDSFDDEQWGTAKLVEMSTELNGYTATLTYSVSLTFGDGSTQSLEETMQTLLIDNEWYISAFQIPEISSNGGIIGVLPLPFEGDLYVTTEGNGNFGFMDEANNMIISNQYQETHGFVNGYAAVKSNGQWGLIDKSNRLVINFRYQECGDYVNGVIPAKRNGYWGAIDIEGDTVVEFLYDTMGSCSLASVKLSDIYGYERTVSFRYGYAEVSLNDAFGVIDTKGKFVIELDRGCRFLIEEKFIYDYGKGYYDDSSTHRVYSSLGEKLFENWVLVVGFSSDSLFLEDVNGMFIADYSGKRKVDLSEKLNPYLSEYPKQSRFSGYHGVRYGRYGCLLNNDGVNHGMNSSIVIVEILENAAGYPSHWNVVDSDGNLRYEKWIKGGGQWIPDAFVLNGEYAIGYATGEGSKLYDSSGNVVLQSEDRLSFWRNDHVISKTMIAPLGRLDEIYEFSEVEIINANVAIVTEQSGIYYGLFVVDTLLYDTKYTKIEYDKHEDVFILNRGADRTRIKVNRDGEVIVI